MRRLAAVVSILALGLALLIGGDQAAAGAGSGPPLGVPAKTLAAALSCSGDLGGAGPTPVLLVPGTTLTAEVNFSWNYETVFSAAGRPWCAVTLPNHAMSDIQVAGEYVVSAIRTMHEWSSRRISVVGFSQGGMVPRWALKWWPDTRAMIDDLVGIDPSNHGTLDAQPICLPGCAPSIWQQRNGSAFLTALNAGQETYPGISYTQMYTATDEVVVPNLGPAASSALHTGPGRISNVLVQAICPVHLADHLTMGTFDPVAYALVIDALSHDGPADAARVARSVCTEPTIPGLNPVSVLANFTRLATVAATQVALYPHVPAEPPLAAYTRG
ncbi:MAG: esterase/lipase family protein [Jatrophihabitans sp.]